MKIHVEWGMRALDAECDALVIVDCLSFSTAVCVAGGKGAKVYPFGLADEVVDFASQNGIRVANKRDQGGMTLSPPSLARLKPNEQIILPSPNGSTLSLFAEADLVVAGWLRNAVAVAAWLNTATPERVMIVAAGEKWPDGTLRPAFEDWVASGAIIAGLEGAKTTEALAAEAAFKAVKNNLKQQMLNCVSGQELCSRGFEPDVAWAADVDADNCVPKLHKMAKTYADFGVVDKKIRHKNIRYFMA